MLQKKYGEAIDVCDRISIIQRLLGRLDQLANLFTSRGNILLKLGRIDEAEKAAGEALSIKSILNRIEVNAQCISLLGRIAQAKCDWNLAISHFSESIKLQMQISRPEGAAIDLESLGECCESIGDYTNAIYAYKESAKICKSIGNRHKNKELKEKIKNVMGK
jgi:tetratricopeptide (TPR) repeat protein